MIIDPETFTPQIDPNIGKYETWGINDQGDDSEDSSGLPKFLQRHMNAQMLYLGKPSPQEQFIALLCDKKVKEFPLI